MSFHARNEHSFQPMLQDQGGEEMNCLPWAVVPRSGLHRRADLLLLLLSLLLLQLSETAEYSPSQASSGRRKPDVPFPVRALPGGLEEGTSCPKHPRSELRGSGTGSLWHRRNTRPPPPDFRRDYSSQNAGRGRAGLGRAVLPRGMLGDVVLSPLPSVAAAVGEVREGWSSCCTTSRVISSVNSRLLSPL